MGSSFSNAALYSFSVSFSYIIIAALSPILSGIADFSGRRMFFLKVFTMMGSLNCMVLYFSMAPTICGGWALLPLSWQPSALQESGLLRFVPAHHCYRRSIRQGQCQGLFLWLCGQRDLIGIYPHYDPKTVLVWHNRPLSSFENWLCVGGHLVGRLCTNNLQNLPKDNRSALGKGFIRNGYREINKVLKEALTQPDVSRFLIGFFFTVPASKP